jgi:hypothetical protein
MVPAESELKFPVLGMLTIDGRNYLNAWRRDSVGWLNAVKNVDDLTVSRYTPRAGESFSTHALVPPLIDMIGPRHLRIVDVDLCHSESHGGPTTPWLESLITLELRDMAKFQLVAELLDLMEGTIHTILVKCAMGRPVDYFGWHGYLTLEDIDETEDMVTFLDMWRGGRLTVKRCPGFNDRALDAISMSESIHDLRIVDCPNFSVEALKRMVGALEQNSKGLDTLRVSGQLLPPFSDAIGWFTENVNEFTYQCEFDL